MKNFMKKTFALSLILTIALGAFTACSSDDDDNDGGSDLAAKAAGTYVGDFESLSFKGETTVVVTVVSGNEALVTFAAVANVAPFKVKLVDTKIQGIIQNNSDPIFQFYSQTDDLRIVGSTLLFTFIGEKQ